MMLFRPSTPAIKVEIPNTNSKESRKRRSARIYGMGRLNTVRLYQVKQECCECVAVVGRTLC